MTDSNTPPVRVWLFGKFLVKLRNNNGTEEEVRNAAWATTYARPLLKRLVPATGRRASRSTLLTDLFPQKSDDEIGKEEESQEKRKNKYLSDAATKLRQILGHEIINPLGSHGAGGYELAGPAFLWSDVEECGLLVKEAEGLPLVEALSRLEKASEYFKRGELLEGEDGQWCHAFRRSQEKAMRQCHIML